MFSNILDNVLRGEKLQVLSDWYLAVGMLKQAIQQWGVDLEPIYFSLSESTARVEVDKAVVLIEIYERLYKSAFEEFGDIFGFDCRSDPEWNDVYGSVCVPMELIVKEICKQFGFGWIEDLVRDHMKEVGFEPFEGEDE